MVQPVYAVPCVPPGHDVVVIVSAVPEGAPELLLPLLLAAPDEDAPLLEPLEEDELPPLEDEPPPLLPLLLPLLLPPPHAPSARHASASSRLSGSFKWRMQSL
jgi:hypothetical protein